MKSSHLWGLFILSGVWEVDEKGGSNAESADEALSRGRGNFRATDEEIIYEGVDFDLNGAENVFEIVQNFSINDKHMLKYIHMGKDPFIWNAHEYYFQEKTTDWYWTVGILGVSIATISIIYGNVLFALLVLVSTIALSVFASKEPALVRFEINKSGILIGKTLFPFGTLDSFWVEDNKHLGHTSQLFIKSKRTMVPLIAIPLEGVNPEDLRDFLLDHLLETPHNEPLGQKILEYFGF